MHKRHKWCYARKSDYGNYVQQIYITPACVFFMLKGENYATKPISTNDICTTYGNHYSTCLRFLQPICNKRSNLYESHRGDKRNQSN